MNHTTIPEFVVMETPDIGWEPPRRNVLPDEGDIEYLKDDWDYGELNFDGEV